jgi:hypothetical protein
VAKYLIERSSSGIFSCENEISNSEDDYSVDSGGITGILLVLAEKLSGRSDSQLDQLHPHFHLVLAKRCELYCVARTTSVLLVSMHVSGFCHTTR